MRLLRHFTANDEQLDPFPFKRELSMEAYLIENEGILALDDDLFSNVEIIDEELTLKQGRKSNDTDGRIDILTTYSQEYIGIIELKLGQLENIHLEQLEDYLLQKDQILETYPEIIDKESVSNPKWIGIIVGSSINSDLANKISNGYVTNSGVPIAALTIQRYRSKIGNIYVTTDSYFKEPSTKDTSKYIFNKKELGKGRLVLEVIRQHVENNPGITFAELENLFPPQCQGGIGVFATYDDANKIYTTTNRKRHFIKAEEQIKLSDSTITICSQWGIKNIGRFIEKAQELGYQIHPSR